MREALLRRLAWDEDLCMTLLFDEGLKERERSSVRST